MKITSVVENTSKYELKASPQVTLLDGDYKIDEELSLITVTRTGKCQICFIYLAERPLRFDALPCPATVDEAVELLGQYDMNFSLDSAHHFSIADATGRSVVVEWMGDEMYVSETNVVTNHYLAGKINNQLKQEVHKYEKTDCHLWAGLRDLRRPYRNPDG